MKKAAVLAIMLIFTSPRAEAQSKECSRVTFGVEWSCICTILSGYHNNYFSHDGYRFNDRAVNTRPFINGEALIHVGYDLNKDWNISLLTGITGMADIHNAVPVSLRATRYYRQNKSDDRWFTYFEAGSGFSIKDEIQEILAGKVGGGYRISLSQRTKLDFHADLRCSYGHGRIYHEGQIVRLNRTMVNDALVLALSLGMALTF